MPVPVRSIPEDFTDRYREMTFTQLCRHYQAGGSAVSRWRREAGLESRRRGGVKAEPVPADFHTHPTSTPNAVLTAIYGVSATKIGRWRKQAGITSTANRGGRPRPKMAPPEDFATYATTVTNADLKAMHGVSESMISRWRRETGASYVRPKKLRQPKPKAEPKPRKLPPSFLERMGKPKGQIFYIPPRDTTLEGQAADVLRAYAPVYRCNECGRQDCAEARKRWWRYGNVILTPDELIQRAAAKGWRAAA